MKTKTLILLVAGLISFAPFTYADAPKTNDKVISISDAYIPSGFDSGSDAFVVVNGLFPNGCYRYKESKVDHVGPALHEVRAFATVSEGLCLMVLVPFSKEVQLGKMAKGDHAIRFMNGDGTYWEKRLTIE